jgi:hypothetical protein
VSITGTELSFLISFPERSFANDQSRFEHHLTTVSSSLCDRIRSHMDEKVKECSIHPHTSPFSFILKMTATVLEPQQSFPDDQSVTAAIKDESVYTYFKLATPKLTINRRGKDVVFKKGDPLGWRMSTTGTHLRIISPIHGKNIIYSIKIDDSVLKWLDKQDPNAKKKRGQLKSDKTEDSANKLIGYVITDGTNYFKLTPKPEMSGTIEKSVIYPTQAKAKWDAAPFMVEHKLKIKPVFTKDLGKAKIAS